MTAEKEILRGVAQAMRAGKGRVLVGAGLSMQSGLKSWLDLLRPIIREGLGIELEWYDDLPDIAQFYVDRVPGGRSRLIAEVAADVARPVGLAPVHRALANLPIAECWTTNFDSLLEQALRDHLVVETDADLLDAARQAQPLLIKMHGSLPRERPTREQIDRVVLTRDDFEDYQQQHPRLWSRVASGYLSGSMLFVGLSLSDPNMRLLQKLARGAEVAGVDSSSVVVLRVPTDEQEKVRFETRAEDLIRAGVTVLAIDTHDDLIGVMTRLREMLRPPRVIISGSDRGMGVRTGSRVVEAAEFLGAQLAERDVPIVHAGSVVGAAVARRLAEMASILRTYDPTAITTVRQRTPSGATFFGYSPVAGMTGVPRDGTIRFIGESYAEMRAELSRLGCVAAVIGGGSGSAEEARMFMREGIVVVPWPATGGVAAELSAQLESSLEGIPENMRATTRAALNSTDLQVGAVALANVLLAIQRPFADLGPTSEADPTRLN